MRERPVLVQKFMFFKCCSPGTNVAADQEIYIVPRLSPFSAFWLRSSVVSVLISVKTGIVGNAFEDFHSNLCDSDCLLSLLTASTGVLGLALLPSNANLPRGGPISLSSLFISSSLHLFISSSFNFDSSLHHNFHTIV